MLLSVTLIDSDRSLPVSIIDRFQNFAIACKYLKFILIFLKISRFKHNFEMF